jgi:hypothetical protein
MSMSAETPWGDEPCEPNSAEWQRRFDWFMAQPTEGWWWLSFADDEAPPGERFRGVCIVPGGNIVQATQTAWDLGINPGGQVAGWPLEHEPYPRYVGKLFRGAEGKAMGDTPLWDDDERVVGELETDDEDER